MVLGLKEIIIFTTDRILKLWVKSQVLLLLRLP